MNGTSTTPIGQADIPDLSRVTFFDGERLSAVDLNDAATVQRELRWLHNRSLHNWGIGLGFAARGNKGDHQVTIGPGYAIDCRGREIILTETITKAVPARADDGHGLPVFYYLVSAYPDDTKLMVLERRQGECETNGAVRLRDRADIYWKAQDEQAVQVGIEIVLAQATVQNCQLAKALSLDQRRSARPFQQPFIAAGETPKGRTPWELSMANIGGQATVIGVQTEVDTSAARFGARPEYQAQLRGDRFVPAAPATNQPALLVEGMAFVSYPKRNSFNFNVFLPRSLAGLSTSVPMNPESLFTEAGSKALLKWAQEKWWVVWVGVEG